MKIFAYEVRPDERSTFDRISKELGVEVVLSPDILTEDNVSTCDGFDGVTTLGRSHLNWDMFKKLKEQGIRAVSTRTIGYNHIDLNAAKEFGIPVCNTAYGGECVADYTVMLLLMSLRNYKPALWRMQVNDYSLGGLIGRQVHSLTVGIVGTGRIGRQVMKNLSGFGCKILCYDPFPSEEAAKLGTYVPLEEIWKNCDAISFHAPLTKDNVHMVNRETLAQMKDGVVLINTARDGLMDMDAVTEAVENQKIGKLALDVFEDEEGIYHRDRRDDIIKNRSMAYLRQFPNVVMTPHMAFYTEEAVESMVIGGVKGLCDLVETGKTATRIG